MNTLAQALNQGLDELLTKHKQLFLIGQDIGKNGGVFKVTKGLQKKTWA